MDNVYNETGAEIVYQTLANNTRAELSANFGPCKMGVETDQGTIGFTDHLGAYRSLSVEGHDHDDLYYTQSEIDTLLSGIQAPSVLFSPDGETEAVVADNDGNIVVEGTINGFEMHAQNTDSKLLTPDGTKTVHDVNNSRQDTFLGSQLFSQAYPESGLTIEDGDYPDIKRAGVLAYCGLPASMPISGSIVTGDIYYMRDPLVTIPVLFRAKSSFTMVYATHYADAQSILFSATLSSTYWDKVPWPLSLAGNLRTVSPWNPAYYSEFGQDPAFDGNLHIRSMKNGVPGLIVINEKLAFTPEGGIAHKYINKTGAASVKGYMVSCGGTCQIDDSFVLSVVNVPDPIGIVYEGGIADGQECWVVTEGCAEAYFIGNATRGQFARGFVTGDAGYVAGQVLAENVPSTPFATDKHFYEIGHVRQSRTGAGLARIQIHKN
jgi:hypothetical protein